MSGEHLVFVYGTLKSGEPNSGVMMDVETGQATLIGKAQTLEKYPLIIASKFNIPFLLLHPGNGHIIEGEVYTVDDRKLALLDEFEAHPHFYLRNKYPVKMINNGSQMEVWIYLLPTWRDELFNGTTTAMYSSYSSIGEHGLEYVPIDDVEDHDRLYACLD